MNYFLIITVFFYGYIIAISIALKLHRRYPKEFRYYERVLKKKCLRKFKNNVWENKVKWKLIEKADFHLRGKLLRKYLLLWVEFLNEAYKKKINRRAAVFMFEEKLKSKGILALKRNAEQNWMLLRVCKKKHEWNVKFKCWHQWKHYTQKRLKVREIKLLANKIREERLRAVYEKAAIKHQTKLKSKYFNLWKIFKDKRVCKKKIERLSTACYRDRLQEKVFHSWRQHASQKTRYRSYLKIIQTFHETYLLENYLKHWWDVYNKLKLERDIFNHKLAVEFHSRKLLERSFRVIWRVKETARERKEKINKFHDVHRSVYLEHYLKIWMERKSAKIAWNYLEDKGTKWREDYLTELLLGTLIERHREREEEREEMNRVVKYSNAIIIHRAFKGWAVVADKRKTKRMRCENASDFYLDKLCKVSFEKWWKYVGGRRQKKMADEYYGKSVLLGALDNWRVFILERRMILMEVENLRKKCDLKLMGDAFSSWKNEFQVFKAKVKMAVDFYKKSKTSKVFCTWRKNTQIRVVNKKNYNRKLIILQSTVINQVIFRWYKMYSVKQNLNKKLKELKSRQERRLAGYHFTTWRKFLDKMKRIRQAVAFFPQLRSTYILEQYLTLLLEASCKKRFLKKKEELARRTGEKLLRRRYLRKWVSFVRWKKDRIQEISTGRCFPEEVFEIPVLPQGRVPRRKPLIPSYLKPQFDFDEFEEEISLNDVTYRIEQPVNRKLPVAEERESFVSFDL